MSLEAPTSAEPGLRQGWVIGHVCHVVPGTQQVPKKWKQFKYNFPANGNNADTKRHSRGGITVTAAVKQLKAKPREGESEVPKCAWSEATQWRLNCVALGRRVFLGDKWHFSPCQCLHG